MIAGHIVTKSGSEGVSPIAPETGATTPAASSTTGFAGGPALGIFGAAGGFAPVEGATGVFAAGVSLAQQVAALQVEAS